MGLAGKRILVIDDDGVHRTLVKRVLEAAGCGSVECAGVREAIEVLNSSAPDAIILDLSMPEVDGYTFLKFRKQNSNLSQIPVIVLSGERRLDQVERAFELGADQFLVKPFESKNILQKLRYLFFSRSKRKAQFTEQDAPAVNATVGVKLTEVGPSGMVIESQIKLASGKSVVLGLVTPEVASTPAYMVVSRVQNKLGVGVASGGGYRDGFYRSHLSITGFDQTRLSIWRTWVKKATET